MVFAKCRDTLVVSKGISTGSERRSQTHQSPAGAPPRRAHGTFGAAKVSEWVHIIINYMMCNLCFAAALQDYRMALAASDSLFLFPLAHG